MPKVSRRKRQFPRTRKNPDKIRLERLERLYATFPDHFKEEDLEEMRFLRTKLEK